MNGKDLKVYSLAYDANKYVDSTKWFRVYEFKCKDGSDMIPICPQLVNELRVIRAYFMGKYPEKTIQCVINSAYRSDKHNDASGGSTYSQHLYATGVDFRITGVPNHEVQKLCDTLWPNCYGIGYAESYTHLDVRDTKARWTY